MLIFLSIIELCSSTSGISEGKWNYFDNERRREFETHRYSFSIFQPSPQFPIIILWYSTWVLHRYIRISLIVVFCAHSWHLLPVKFRKNISCTTAIWKIDIHYNSINHDG